jgi:hypothetical protein
MIDAIGRRVRGRAPNALRAGFSFHRRRWEKQESHWAWQPQRLVLPHASGLMRVDWPAQPYLTLPQVVFHGVFPSCFVSWNRPYRLMYEADCKCPVCSPSSQLRTAVMVELALR